MRVNYKPNIVEFLLVVVLLTIPIFGCKGDSEDIEAIQEELKKINERLDKLENNPLQKFLFENPPKHKGPDLAELGKIKFPSNPTKEALKSYIREILDISSNLTSYSSDDPQVDLLAEVGEENIDLLIHYSLTNPGEDFYLNYAIDQIATPKSKSKILDALPFNRDLISVVVRYEWEAEVKEILVEALLMTVSDISGGNYLPRQWIKAVAGFKDPTTYDALIFYFVNGSNRSATYEIIKDLPGIDLDAHVIEAWEKALLSHEWERISFAPIAIGYGRMDALEILIDHLNDPSYSRERGKMWAAIIKHTEAKGSNDDLIEWYNENKDNLIFDKKSKKFMKKK